MKKLSFVALGLLLLNSCSQDNTGNPTSQKEPIKEIAKYIPYDIEGQVVNVLGHGCDVTKEYASANSTGSLVIDIDKLKAEQPGRVEESWPHDGEMMGGGFENAVTYCKFISKMDPIAPALPFALFGGELANPFPKAKTSSNKFDKKYIYGMLKYTNTTNAFKIIAVGEQLQNYLTSDFQSDLNTKTPEQLVAKYGTHIYTGIAIGTRFDIKYQSETTYPDRQLAAQVGTNEALKNFSGYSTFSDYDSSINNKNFNKTVTYTIRGGDRSKVKLTNAGPNQPTPSINLEDWITSITPENSVLIDITSNGLMPIYNVISDPTKKAEVKSYVDQYLIDNQVILE